MATTMERSKKGVRVARPAKQVDESTYAGRFAARLKALRLAAKIDVEKFASDVTSAGYKVSAQGVYHWEAGHASPPIPALPCIAKALKLKSVRRLMPDE